MNTSRMLFALLLTILSQCPPAYGDDDPTTKCMNENFHREALDVLKGKFIIPDTQNPTLEELANRQKPTKSEKTALSDWSKENDRCIELGARWRRINFSKDVASIYDSYFSTYKDYVVDLYSGRISYGKLVKQRAALIKSKLAEIKETNQRIEDARFEAELERDRQEEEAKKKEEERQAKIAEKKAEIDRRQAEIDRENERLEELKQMREDQEEKNREMQTARMIQKAFEDATPNVYNCTRFDLGGGLSSVSCQ